MKKSNKKKYLILGIVFTICIMIGASYAWWTSTATQQGINEIQSDCLNITLDDENEISLTKAYPLTDEEAKELEPYTFTIQNQCNTKVNYKVKLEQLTKDKSNVLKSEYIAIEVNGGQKQILSEYPTIESSYTEKEYESVEAKNIVNGTLEGNESKKYSLKLWMDEHVTLQDDATNKSFISKIIVEGGMNNLADYTEPILHGADPVLESSSKPVAMLTANEVGATTTDKLIPVIIGENGKVTKANTKEEWYNYEEQEWANAVILVDNTKEYKDGEEILESNIESYFVWIPKYKYKLFNMGNYTSLQSEIEDRTQKIEIKFDLTNTENKEGECETQNESGATGECSIGKWMTHPAFTSFGDIKGMWVGKFETGYKDATSQTFSENNKTNTNKEDLSKIVVKPNQLSWKNISVSNAYFNSYNYQREMDSHMMKNTEWGAVAYLSHSTYGGCKEITPNTKAGFTGYTYSDNSYIENSVDASTTGNYSGIYDMSGGLWEYVMAFTLDTDEHPIYSLSGFDASNFPNHEKYYDTYGSGGTISDYTRRILGDATGELGPFIEAPSGGRSSSCWYQDGATFPYNNISIFFQRGNGPSPYNGIFSFNAYNGQAYATLTFRIVLTP